MGRPAAWPPHTDDGHRESHHPDVITYIISKNIRDTRFGHNGAQGAVREKMAGNAKRGTREQCIIILFIKNCSKSPSQPFVFNFTWPYVLCLFFLHTKVLTSRTNERQTDAYSVLHDVLGGPILTGP